ncbi:MAG: hypothetical protein WAK86_13570, partial [Pseudonocardiaceae bacterium]
MSSTGPTCLALPEKLEPHSPSVPPLDRLREIDGVAVRVVLTSALATRLELIGLSDLAHTLRGMNWKLELVAVPVTDVDRAKAFYVEQVGFHADVDHQVDAALRFVQLTPPGSACSIMLG